MNFKKDYINYVLYTIIQNELYGVRDDARIRKVLEKIISVSDVAKAAFLAGKTAGLETLFKYLLYISDKIDKSQITIFNIKDNFEYDLLNLKKICDGIKSYRSEIPKTKEIAEETAETILTEEGASADSVQEEETETAIADEKEELAEETETAEEAIEETEEVDEESAFTLIENKESNEFDDDVFGLEGISRSVETDEQRIENETVPPQEISENAEENLPDEESIIEPEPMREPFEDIFDVEPEDEILTAADIEKLKEVKGEEIVPEKREDFEFEIKEAAAADVQGEEKEGSVTSEAYYKFETKFFEEVKILEKLFSNTEKECKGKNLVKLKEKTLQGFTEIIEISSELADLTRKLSFDLTADIFMTINLLFTKAIQNPALINPERIRLLSSSLMLVTSLIKGEDYLGYDELVNKTEALKEELKKPAEQVKEELIPEEIKEELKPEPEQEPEPEPEESKPEPEPEPIEPEAAAAETKEDEVSEPTKPENKEEESALPEYPKEIIEQPVMKQENEAQNMDTVLFKMKYLVKEFEKNFTNLSREEGKYTKFEMLDEIDNLNNLLRMLARISSSVKNFDVLKLSEVSYVFLKYLKDYRMDLLDAEIQQIVKYIIFTYKMLLTERKPEDFDILVQYLNNPVKIFTDT